MPAKGSWDDSWAAWAFSPSISAILVTFFISITLPIIFHYFLYRKAAPKQLPTILLLGPSGGGKTTLLTSVGHVAAPKESNVPNTFSPSSQTANPPSPTPAKPPKQPSANSPPTTHPTKTASAPKTTPPRATSPSSSSSTPRATANYDTMPSPRSKRHQP
jgi:signal recognition particle receptor subunit beta